MMPFDYDVHKPVKGGAEHEVTENAYTQIGGPDGSFLLRGGKFWSADGLEIPDSDVPDWVWDIIDKMKDKGASVGFAPPPEQAKFDEAEAKEPAEPKANKIEAAKNVAKDPKSVKGPA